MGGTLGVSVPDLERKRHRKGHEGCSCHPYGSHAHDRDVSRGPAIRLPNVLEIEFERRLNQKGHDAGVVAQYEARKREIERAGGLVLSVTTELQLKRAISRDIQASFEVAGHVSAWELERIAREHGCQVAEDGRIKIPDVRVEYMTSSGQVKVENQDYRSGRGYRIALKVSLGFKIGNGPGMSSRKIERGLRIRDRSFGSRRASPDEKPKL